MTENLPHPGQQNGSVILEALIAILVFSMGILALVGMQAAAISAASAVKYRSDAALLANELIGKMWVSDRTQATLQAAFSSAGGAAYQDWAWVGGTAAGTAAAPAEGTVLKTLPGASTNLPTVSIAAIAPAVLTVPPTPPTSLVTITIFWQAPTDATRHQYVTTAQIGG